MFIQSSYKRAPRNPKYIGSYAGHFLQGFICGLLIPPPLNILLAAVGYRLYQLTEYRRFADRRDALLRWGDKAGVDDWPSRDIADHLAGIWTGIAIQAAAVAIILVALAV